MTRLLPFVPLLCLLALPGCDEQAPPVSAPQPVLVIQPQPAAEAERHYPGEVRARHEPALAFRLGGKVVERLVDVGERVAAGAPLARLDAEDVKLRLEAAKARQEAAEAALRVAGSERERYRALLERRLVSQSQFDQVDNRYRAAEAELEQARAEYRVLGNQLDYTVLRAPQDGVIVSRAVEEGQVVAAGQTVFVLAADGEREVAIDLPESQLASHRVGQPARVALWSQPGERYQGHIRELSSSADPASRTYSARVAFDRIDVPAALGQSAQVHLLVGEPGPLAVPLTAVTAEDGRAYVWRLRPDATLARAPVRIGAYGERSVPVLEGVSADDWIVLAGVHLLREGQEVRPLDRDNRPVPLPGE